jgi:hypothetical protein
MRVVAAGGEALIKSRCAECWQQWKVSDGIERRQSPRNRTKDVPKSGAADAAATNDSHKPVQMKKRR